jgi:type 1 fimbria pilin
MKKLLPFAVLLAVPAQAQDAQVYYASDTWPVHASGRTCTMMQAASSADGRLSVSYDGTEVTLATTNTLESELPDSGKVSFAIVFLDNGASDLEFDDGWGSREFTYSRDDGDYHFSARFAGENNVRQILSDLANSKTIGLLQRGKAVMAYDLADVGGSIARLRECAARSIAAN